jgi:hypothetical protein
MTSPDLSVVAASAASVVSGVYGVMKELGDTVVGCEMPLDIFFPLYTFATSSSKILSPFSQISTILAPSTHRATSG